ncbi:MAG: aldolase/citrate lyase family protein [Actinobacteria bacterium]|nr:aldolase/citrate lyase family protein [Actinomycetota bacterium]
MNNNLNRLREKFSKNELVIGTIVSTNCPTNSEILCRCGYDFIWIDGEHGAMDNVDIDLHIMAVSGSGCAPIVRVRWNDPVIVKPILDMGPAGIIFPWIRKAQDAELAVSSCKYPPKGIRGYGPEELIITLLWIIMNI